MREKLNIDQEEDGAYSATKRSHINWQKPFQFVMSFKWK